jgi:hypothetical protein
MKPKRTLLLLAAALAVSAGLFWSGEIAPITGIGLVSQAHAIIGRPLTPISYAGVARRSLLNY